MVINRNLPPIGFNQGNNRMQIRNSLAASNISLLLERNNGVAAPRNGRGTQSAPNLTDTFTRSADVDDSHLFDYSRVLKNRGNNFPGSSQGIYWDSDGRPRMLDEQGRLVNPNFSLPEWDIIEHEQFSLDSDIVKWRLFYQNQVNYANTFLFGRDGGEPIGQTAFQRFLTENNIELPDGANFNIGVDRYGTVTITGLEDAELTAQLESAMSYDFRFIRATLAMFVEATKTIENNAVDGGMGMSDDQHRLMGTNSTLRNYWGIGMHDLSLDANGKIQGLPEELYNQIYGSRTGMTRQESEALDRFRDNIVHFLRVGTESIPTYDISLTFDNGRVGLS